MLKFDGIDLHRQPIGEPSHKLRRKNGRYVPGQTLNLLTAKMIMRPWWLKFSQYHGIYHGRKANVERTGIFNETTDQ
jgi:hypothetical protein